MSYKGGFNEKYPSENYHSFQFFKSYSFRGYTSVNFTFLFYGQKKENKNLTLISKFFKENWYVTSYTQDYCKRENTRIIHNFTLDEVYDHQFLLCVPNGDCISESTTIRCLYGKNNEEYLFIL